MACAAGWNRVVWPSFSRHPFEYVGRHNLCADEAHSCGESVETPPTALAIELLWRETRSKLTPVTQRHVPNKSSRREGRAGWIDPSSHHKWGVSILLAGS